ncbi:MAG: hypothetical protein WD690_02365 [Vicinamibacterales bacterium]
MSQYRFEKIRVPAELSLTQGPTIPGSFFVAGSAFDHDGPERVSDVLNSRTGFLPFQRVDGTTGLYNRAHIVLVRLGQDVVEAQADPGYDVAKKRRVSMRLSTGEEVAGLVPIYRPPGRDRLSDYSQFNEPFRYLVMADRTLLVNSAHIVELTEIAD